MYLDSLTIAGTLIAVTFIGLLLAIRSRWYCVAGSEDPAADCEYVEAVKGDAQGGETQPDRGTRQHGFAEGSTAS